MAYYIRVLGTQDPFDVLNDIYELQASPIQLFQTDNNF